MTFTRRLLLLLRRLGVMLYDTFALTAVLLLAVAVVVIPLEALWGITGTGGHPLFQLYVLLIIVGFYGWFWTHGGQTLGLRAWHLRVVRDDGGPLSWGDALKRMSAALLSLAVAGLGFLWVLIDRDGRAWHDRLTRTRVERSHD